MGGILQTIKDLSGCLGSPRRRMLACISRDNEVCMSYCSENADMHADAGKSLRLLGEVWRVLRVSHYSLGSRGVPCSLAGRDNSRAKPRLPDHG